MSALTPEKVLDAARLAADLLLALVPDHGAARDLLDAAAIRRANAAADVAEQLKFGNAPTEPSTT